MNVTNITTEDRVKFDPFLVETIVKPKDTNKVKSQNVLEKSDWESNILKNGISKLENSIQSTDDTSPLSYNSAPPINNNKEAVKVINEIDKTDLINNIDEIFNNLKIESISNLFLAESDFKY